MHKEKDHAKHVQIELLVTPVPNLPVPQVLGKGSAQKKPQHAGCVRMGSPDNMPISTIMIIQGKKKI